MSPASKSGRPEKEARVTAEGSPSAKGSLDNYLEKSKDGSLVAKSLDSVSDHVRRNLTLDSRLLSRDVDCHPPHVQPQSHEASGVDNGSKIKLLSDIGSNPTTGIENDSSETETTVQNSELKEFAVDFLSLYCR